MTVSPGSSWRSAWRAGRDLVLPRACVSCGRPGVWWCRRCVDTIGHAGSRGRLGGIPVTAAAPYEGVARDLMLAVKDRHITAAAEPLGHVLARVPIAVDLPLVPVPGSARSWWERGFDPLELILAHTPGARVRRCLAWRGRRRPQKSLSRAQRQRNVAGALRVRSGVAGPVVVVDDVITTGATVVAAVTTLRAAGIAVAAVVGVCSVGDPWQHASGLRVSVKHEAEEPGHHEEVEGS